MADTHRLLGSYRRGWIAGAGFDEYDKQLDSEAYRRGYADGREAFYNAMRAERRRLGLPEARLLFGD